MLALAKRLIKERQDAESHSPQKRLPDHPAHSGTRHQQGPGTRSELGEAPAPWPNAIVRAAAAAAANADRPTVNTLLNQRAGFQPPPRSRSATSRNTTHAVRLRSHA